MAERHQPPTEDETRHGRTIVQKALSGDLQAVAFCLNLQQQQRDPNAEEAIAHNMINAAMKGDVMAAQYIQNIQMRAKIMKIRAPFTQGGGLRRGCAIAA